MNFEITPEWDMYDIEIDTSDMMRIITLAQNLKEKIIESPSPYHYIRIITNIMHVVEIHFYRKKIQDYEKCSLVVSILHEIVELNGMQDIHYSMVEDMYLLLHSNRLKKIKELNSSADSCRCCVIA